MDKSFSQVHEKDELISRQTAIDAINSYFGFSIEEEYGSAVQEVINSLPPAQPEYEPVKAEDFAKTMSENTIYSFMTWHGEALELMERHGFVICKKTM